jgi:hypothetical protein
MKKLIIILVTAFLLTFNLVIPTTVLAGDPGPPKEKEWKGKGEKIEFQSMPILTMKECLNGVVPEKTKTIWGTLNFPANALDKNVPVVVIMHGMNGIDTSEEHWMKVFNSIGLYIYVVPNCYPP